jgi:hypothetical protein
MGNHAWCAMFFLPAPPPVASGGLSHATARPGVVPGCSRVTTGRPLHPISPGKRCGNAAHRRSHVRRLGKRPGSPSRGRNCWGSGASWSKNTNKA